MPARLKKEIRDRLLVAFIWLLLITLLRWQWQWELVGLWLGGLIGAFFLEIDHLLYVFLIYPQELTSQRVKRFFDQNRFKDILILLNDTRQERIRLTFHSALFQVIFWVVCFFVLTSTGNLFGIGLVMVAALQLLLWEIRFLLEGKDKELHQRLFWQVQATISLAQQKTFIFVMTVLFLVMSLFLA